MTLDSACATRITRHIKSRSTGKERDSESGNDYFGARYYSSTLGRFISPDFSDSPDDVPYADFENPQTLNLYAYVGNNPMTGADPDGHGGCNSDGMTSVITFFSKDIQQGPDGSYSSQPPCPGLNQPGIVSGISNAANRGLTAAQSAFDAFSKWANTPRDQGCMARTTAFGAGVGGGIGVGIGATLGGAGGAGAGLVTTGGAASIPLGAGGAYLGGALGGATGTVFGAGVGHVAGMFFCSTGSGGNGGTNSTKFDPRNAEHRKLTGQQIIDQFKKGSIKSQFPAQYLDKTFNEIDKDSSQGIDAAQTARKLLTDSRFNK